MNDQTIDSLDETLDDLADLPQEKPFPAGSHIATMIATKNKEKAGAYMIKFKYKETPEFANPNLPDEERPIAGDEAVVFVNTIKKDGTKNIYGQGTLKLLLSPLAELFGTRVPAEICEQSQAGVEVLVTNTVRVDKSKTYPPSMDVKAIQVI